MPVCRLPPGSTADPAAARLQQAAEARPDDPELCLDMANLLIADGAELALAGTMLGRVPEGYPRRDPAVGRLAELRGDFAAAEAAWSRQLARGDDPEARLHRAMALVRLGRDGEAIAELERLRGEQPGDVVVRTLLAERYEAAGRLTDTEAELRWLAEAPPPRPEGWRRLAAFYRRNGQAQKAGVAEDRARAAESKPQRQLRPLQPTGR
jgi:predicted Zn-dependent protease